MEKLSQRATNAKISMSNIPESFQGMFLAIENTGLSSSGKPSFKAVVSRRNFTVWTNKNFDMEGHKYLLKLATTLQKKHSRKRV